MSGDNPPRSRRPNSHPSPTQPTRGADRNRRWLTETTSQPPENTLLPTLDVGITLLDIDGRRPVPIVQSLVLDHLLLREGSAVWIDAEGHATTSSLARLAPSQRLLDRIHVARGFTAYQHYGAVCDLPTAVASQSGDSDGDRTASSPSLIVAPAVGARYRVDDTLPAEHATTLQARVLARLGNYARRYDVPVLVTRTATDEFSRPIRTAADHQLRCEQTTQGPRFVGEEFETLCYPVDGGAFYQTTLAYWRQLLGARAEQVGIQPATPSALTTDDEPDTATTTAGPVAVRSAAPSVDAWTNTPMPNGR